MTKGDRKKREWDLVIYGATGDAGMAIAFYVANNNTSSFRWAIAGRSEKKLNQLRSRIICTRTKPSTVDIGVIVASSSNEIDDDSNNDNQSMIDMAQSTRLVLSAVGPYTTLGEGTVRACVKSGTHYADITGEVPWVLAMKERYQNEAKKTGATLCSFAGYDSVPADISVFLARSALQNQKLLTVEKIATLKGGLAPRGTIRTMISSIPHTMSNVKGMIQFVPAEERFRTFLSLAMWIFPRWSRDIGAFTLPHMVGFADIPVVHNSFAGNIGSFKDRMLLPWSKDCWWTGYGLLQTLGIYCLFFLAAPFSVLFTVAASFVPFVANALLRLYDASQYRGNSARTQTTLANATTEVSTYAIAADGQSKATVHLLCQGDAGILCTALFAAETSFAMLELEDRNELPKGIFGSPSVIAGDALVKRLQNNASGKCTLTVTVDHRGDKKKD